jgi:hypothetical protein
MARKITALFCHQVSAETSFRIDSDRLADRFSLILLLFCPFKSVWATINRQIIDEGYHLILRSMTESAGGECDLV